MWATYHSPYVGIWGLEEFDSPFDLLSAIPNQLINGCKTLITNNLPIEITHNKVILNPIKLQQAFPIQSNSKSSDHIFISNLSQDWNKERINITTTCSMHSYWDDFWFL